MKPKMINKIFSILFCICIAVSAVAFPVFAQGETIVISSADDFTAFSESCTLDSWSKDKFILLDTDIDFTGTTLNPVPIFCGTFDGQGHTMSGISYSGFGAITGIFRHLDAGATIQSLNISANIFPVGTKEIIGGIVGENNGNITDCTFTGNIKAGKNVGGIAGINQGNIMNCTSSGEIYGEHYVGGITGKNLSAISLCTNNANVNVYTEEVKLDLDEINTEKLLSPENTADITDIGGIAGYSGGMIQTCVNNATIGYNHVGYNIGGICGRQTGYINNCTNTGIVLGRKDVGGICGQTEPYTVLKYSENGLQSLQSELDSLETIIDNASKNADSTRNQLAGNFSDTKKYISDARSAAQNIIDSAQNKANDSVGKINNTTDKISNVSSDIGDLVDAQLDAFNNISSSADNISDIIDTYADTLDDIKEIWQNVDISEIKSGIGALSIAVNSMATALKSFEKAMSLVENSLGNTSKLENALSQLDNAKKDFDKAINDINSALDSISQSTDAIIKNPGTPDELKSYFDGLKNNADTIKKSNETLKGNLEDYTTAFKSLSTYLKTLDPQSLISAADQLSRGTQKLYNSIADVSASMKNFQNAAATIQNAIDATKGAVQGTESERGKLSEQLDAIASQLDTARNAIQDFSSKSNISFDKMDNITFDMREELSDAISNISGSADKIFDSVSAFGDTLSGNLSAVKNQISVIMSTMAGTVGDIQNKSSNVKDYIEDVSEYDDSQKQGKISTSTNSGNVSADLNVGGIVGSMAIEYDFDPEDDVATKGDKSLNFIYTTKSVVIHCVNYADISARKNCVAAICGKQDLGMIKDCTATGKLSSESGNYCGGIAGQSASLIRESYSKVTLLGDNYVGGIAGEGDRLIGCYSIAHIGRSNEYAGSIAGIINGKNSENYYVGEFGAIDGISYDGRAQAISYETLKSLPNVPYDLKFFTLTFVADNETINQLYFDYGETIASDKIPKTPKKDGCYGVWDKSDYNNLTFDETVNAVYDNYVGAIESTQLRDNGLPCIVAEGAFSSLSLLTANVTQHSKKSESWDISINACDSDTVKIHYLAPKVMSGVKIKVCEDGKWRNVKCKKDGSYTVFEASPSISAFTVQRTFLWWLIFPAAALLAAAIFFIKKLLKSL